MRKPLSVLCAAVLLAFVAVLVYRGFIVLPDYWTQLAAGLTLLAIGVLCWGWRPEINKLIRGKPKQPLEEPRPMPLDPSLLHLTIHYSRRSDTADHPTRPYYIVNANAKSAFWVPDYMNAAARQGRIQGVRHDGENTLREYLRKEKISPFEGYPTDLAQLGLAKLDLERILAASS